MIALVVLQFGPRCEGQPFEWIDPRVEVHAPEFALIKGVPGRQPRQQFRQPPSLGRVPGRGGKVLLALGHRRSSKRAAAP
jgi:hypothetical protein